MEGIREIATAYYQRSADRDKEAAEAFFRRLDADGDGRVTLSDLKRASVPSSVANENVVRQLDGDGDGVLDFTEVLPVYYILSKLDLVKCSGCWTLLSGPHFSCRLCLGKDDDAFHLCCGCYRQGNVNHEHSLEYLEDYYSLLAELRRHSSVEEKNRRKKEMEELHEIATAHYRASSPEVKKLAYEFFQSLDLNGDSQVNLSEFQEFMDLQGYSQMRNPNFFQELDLDGNGTLDFLEVVTLYYIIKSGRPFCSACKHFIPGTFYSCVECFKGPNKDASFNLCHSCYCSAKCSHNHGGHTQFLDNYTMLEATRNMSLAQATGVASSSQRSPPVPASTAMVPATATPNYVFPPMQQPQPRAYMHTPYSMPCNVSVAYPSLSPGPNNVYVPDHPSPSPVPNYTQAIVPANTSHKWEKCLLIFHALEVAIGIGSIAMGSSCTIL